MIHGATTLAAATAAPAAHLHPMSMPADAGGRSAGEHCQSGLGVRGKKTNDIDNDTRERVVMISRSLLEWGRLNSEIGMNTAGLALLGANKGG